MKSKKWWIALLSIVLAGSLLMGIGHLLGAKKAVYFDATGVHIMNADIDSVVQEETVEAFSKIEVDISSQQVEILSGNAYRIEVLSGSKESIFWEVQNGTLTVREKQMGIFGFDFRLFANRHIKIYVPAGVKMENVEIKASSGNVSVNDLLTQKLQLHVTSGKGELNACQIENLTVRMSSGSVYMKDCEVTTCNLKLTSGTLQAENLKAVQTVMEASSGSIRLSGALSGDTKVAITSGTVTLDLQGSKQDFSKNIHVTSGGVYLDGKRVSGDIEDTQGGKRGLDIEVSSGTVKVNFVE